MFAHTDPLFKSLHILKAEDIFLNIILQILKTHFAHILSESPA